MTPETITAIFTGIALLITTIIGGYVTVIASRVKRQGETLVVLEKNTNSLVAKAEASAHLAGKLEEKTEAGERRQAAKDAVAAITAAGHAPAAPAAAIVRAAAGEAESVKIGDTVVIGDPKAPG